MRARKKGMNRKEKKDVEHRMEIIRCLNKFLKSSVQSLVTVLLYEEKIMYTERQLQTTM